MDDNIIINNSENETGEEMTFIEILEKHPNGIEIPRVQRDYAQGRDTAHVNEVRKCLIDDIKFALGDTGDAKSLNLGFIYGKVSGGKLIPLDGQQRLTLLFLLHVFAFAGDSKQTPKLERFFYETRNSSKRFIEELIKNRSSIFERMPSDNIKDAGWFQDEWRFDPTVQSMLVVLDEIKETLGTIIGLAEKLTAERRIIFLFLPMENLALEDSLYIKLNARGRPLTDWENYKAKLISRVIVCLKDEEQHLFEKKLDGRWTDLFWRIARDRFDEAFKRFFIVQMQNFARGTIDDFDEEELNAISYCLDYLSDHQEGDAFHYFENCCIRSNTNTDKVMLHAITIYMLGSECKADNTTFSAWFRIFNNLAVNTELGDEEYRKACGGIYFHHIHYQNLLPFLANGGSNAGFSGEQNSEEQLKAKLIIGNEKLAAAIYESEKHPYFSGNIAGILHFAGYSKDSAHADADDEGKYERFITYIAKMGTLFSAGGLTCDKILFRRALLSFGHYLLAQGQNYSFCSDSKSGSSGRVGWKVLLRSPKAMPNCGTSELRYQRDCFRALLDRLDFQKEINEQLRKIIYDSHIEEDDWRFHFVKTEADGKGFMDEIGKSIWAIRWTGDWRKIALLTKQQLNGNWHHAGILALSFALKTKKVNHKYHYGAGSPAMNLWYLDGFDNHSLCAKIDFDASKNRFIMIMQDNKTEECGSIETIVERLMSLPKIPMR